MLLLIVVGASSVVWITEDSLLISYTELGKSVPCERDFSVSEERF